MVLPYTSVSSSHPLVGATGIDLSLDVFCDLDPNVCIDLASSCQYLTSLDVLTLVFLSFVLAALHSRHHFSAGTVALRPLRLAPGYVILTKCTNFLASFEIPAAQCGCPAGRGPRASSKHTAALCYALEEFEKVK